MSLECATVDPLIHVNDLIDEVLLPTGRRCIVVKSEAR
jgi:hypothetical protein